MEVNKDHQSAHHDDVGGVARLGVAARRGRGGHHGASDGTPIPEWGYVQSGASAGSLTDVATQASVGIEQLTALVTDLRAGSGTMGKLMTDERSTRMTALVTRPSRWPTNINEGRGTLGRCWPPTRRRPRSLEASLANLEAVTARSRPGEGSLGKLLNDDAMHQSLTSTTSNLDTITGRINQGEGTAGKLVMTRSSTTG